MTIESNVFEVDLFEAVPDALIIADRNGTIAAANRHAEALFDYPHDGLIGLPIEALMPDTLRERHRGHRKDYMASPRVRPMGATDQALIGLRRDGSEFPLEIALSPIRHEDDLRYLASVRDVSESQRVRQALVRARYDAAIARLGQSALDARNEEQVIDGLPASLAAALEVERVAILVLDPSSREIDLRQSIGLREDWSHPARWLEDPRNPLRIVLEEGRATILDDGGFADIPGIASAALLPLFDRGRPMGALLALSSRPNRFDHDAQHMLQSAALFVAALMQRRRTEEDLAHAQRLDAIGQLTGGIAHDFNNLLTVISGSLQLLEAQCGEHAEATALITTALRSVGRGADLTAKLLAFARRQRLSPRVLAPHALLEDVAFMLRRTLGEAIQLAIDCPDDLPSVYADAGQLDAALVNLALNARDAMPRGGRIDIVLREHRIAEADEARALASGRYVEISVIDTGHGMTPEVLARAIDPFFTSKTGGRGSGLGLSMVYGFVKQSGGHLQIESRLGYGTRVDLFLPAADAGEMREQPAKAAGPAGGRETILVVEDEPDVAGIATAFLRSLGYEVRNAASETEALALLDREPDIALLFTDVMLGKGGNGIELAQAARAIRICPYCSLRVMPRPSRREASRKMHVSNCYGNLIAANNSPRRFAGIWIGARASEPLEIFENGHAQGPACRSGASSDLLCLATSEQRSGLRRSYIRDVVFLRLCPVPRPVQCNPRSPTSMARSAWASSMRISRRSTAIRPTASRCDSARVTVSNCRARKLPISARVICSTMCSGL
jgi:PAS domain S-box-containing protein